MKHLPYLSMLLLSTSLFFCAFTAYAQVDVQWDKTLGGDDSEGLTSAISTSDGGYILAGGSSSDASADKSEDSRGGRDYWIVKTDQNGNKLWDRTFGGSGNEYVASVVEARDGGYLLGGTSTSPASGDKSEDSKGGYDYWIVRIDKQGNKLWDKTYGGNDHDRLTSMISIEEGGFLLAGFSESPASGDKSEDNHYGCDNEGNCNNSDFWIIKIDGDGNKEWDKTLGDYAYESLISAVTSPDGGYVLAGARDPSDGRDGSGFDFQAIKIDEDGNKLWNQSYGGNDYDEFMKIIRSPDGGYLLVGGSISPASGDKSEDSKGFDFWIIKIDEEGNKLWDKTLGGDDHDRSPTVIATADGGYLLGGTSTSPASGDKSEDSKGFDFWIIKIDEEGNKLWDKTIGGNNNDHLSEIVPAVDGGYLLAGISYSNASGDKTEDSKGGSDFWIIKVVETEEEDFSIRSLSLMNADTDEVLFSLQDGDDIDLSELGNPQLTIRANTTPINVDSVKLELTGPITHTQVERYYPYALFGDEPDGPRDYIGKMWKAGEYRLTATPYLAGRAGRAHRVSFSVIDDVSASVAYFVLVNADTDQDMMRLRDGDVVDLSALGHPLLSIRANTKPFNVDRVELALSGSFSHTKTEHYWPYALFGDDPDSPRDYKGR